MNWLRELGRRLRMLLHRRQFDADLEEEMRFHLELRQRERSDSGMTLDAARAAANRGFGNVTALREQGHLAWGWEWLESLAQDIRFGLRMLRKSPGFTAVAILTLALGIGANTAIFSLMNTVMLRLLPVQEPEQLVQVAVMTHGFGRSPRTSYTNPLWEEIRDRQDVFAGAFAWGSAQFNLAPAGVAQNVRGIFVSGSYFPTLGVRPAAGRLISPGDDKRGCPGVAVLGNGFWRQQFAAAPVAGNTIFLDEHSFEIIGVSAPGFLGTEVGSAFDVAVPICAEAILQSKGSSLDNRSSWWLRIMARRNPQLSDAQRAARLEVLSPRIFAETVPLNWRSEDQKKYIQWTLTTLPAGNGTSYLRTQYDLPLKTLLAIAGFVLLLACTNIASLLLARAAARAKEIAVRLALGASRFRLIRQLLVESVLLSCSGALLGTSFARWASQLVVRYISTSHDKISLNLALDSRVLLFTATAAIFTGLLFGVLPAFRATRVPLADAMKGASAKNAQGDTKFRSGRWTVVAQIALSLVLVVTAGLFVRSFANLVNLDLGFDRSNVLQADVDLQNAGLSAPRIASTHDEMLQRLRSLPDVISASASVVTPISNRVWDDFIVADAANAPKGDDRDAYMNYVSPGYFATFRTALLEGRDFDEHDTAGGAQVAIVNQTLARKFYGGTDALGKTFRRFATVTTLGPPFLIVGIVRDAKYETVRADFPPTVYFPLSQLPNQPNRFAVELRTASSPSQLAPAVEQAILDVNKSAAIQFTTLAQQVDDSLTQERLLAALSGFFGALAILLAMIGFYGVLSYLLLQRHKELGIRMALGAGRGAILRLVARDVSVLLLTGAAVGLALTSATTWFVQSLLFGLRARDVETFTVGVVLLIAVALVASYLPTRRAMRVDPMLALRDE
ncbi:MAG TPA: ABC transporter permease [Candidatus Methylomirabilis sp.]|nr:ABC transporter permease [Candidatus Methylomirabilis sp.]